VGKSVIEVVTQVLGQLDVKLKHTELCVSVKLPVAAS
jgi:hypothetical protein